jgi:hypothetical protein
VLIALAAFALSLAVVENASAGRYIVIFKTAQPTAGIVAIHQAGGTILNVNKLGIATVTTSNGTFALQVRRSGKVAGVAHDGWFGQKASKPLRFTARATVTPTPAGERVLRLYGVSPRSALTARGASGTCGRSTRRRPARTPSTAASARGSATSTRAST